MGNSDSTEEKESTETQQNERHKDHKNNSNENKSGHISSIKELLNETENDKIRESSKQSKPIVPDRKATAEFDKTTDDAMKNARIANLKKQFWQQVDDIRRKYDDIIVEFDIIEDIETDVKDLQRSYQYKTLTDPIYKRERLYEQYSQVKLKKSQLIRILSETVGEQVKQHNPELAELSSESRAVRVFAKFPDLYDNEFTDLLQVYGARLPHDFEEKLVIFHIRDCLQYCYTKSRTNAKDQRTRLMHILLQDNSIDPDTSAVGLQLRLKEFQKNVAKFTLPSLQFNVLHGLFNHDRLSDMLRRISPRAAGTNPYLRTFLDRSTELCWYAQTQDPAVVLEFEPRRNFGEDYQPYTKPGPYLDYIVWPVLLLYEHGPTLYKGIAQFKGDETVTTRQADTRISSVNRRITNPNKREPKPYDFIPQLEPMKHVRAEISETETFEW